MFLPITPPGFSGFPARHDATSQGAGDGKKP